MTTHKETAEVAGTTTTAKTNNYQAVRTDNDTRTTPDRGKRKPRVFHLVHVDSPEGVRTICGKLIPKRRVIRSSGAIAEQRGRVECRDCRCLYELNAELKADKQRREKAEAIAEMVMRHLENRGER